MSRIELETNADTWASRLGAFEIAYGTLASRKWAHGFEVCDVLALTRFLLEPEEEEEE